MGKGVKAKEIEAAVRVGAERAVVATAGVEMVGVVTEADEMAEVAWAVAAREAEEMAAAVRVGVARA